jgi:hypothetical protein
VASIMIEGVYCRLGNGISTVFVRLSRRLPSPAEGSCMIQAILHLGLSPHVPLHLSLVFA